MQRTLDKLAAGEHVTIVALGDSITHTTFHTQGRMNWVQLLEEGIFETYGNGLCTLINAGRCGGGIVEASERFARDVARFTPDLVIVAMGMNDATQGTAGLPAFRATYRELIARIRELDADVLLRTPNPVVTVHGLPLPPEQPRPNRPYNTDRRPLANYAAAIVDLAAELHCPVVDHYTLWTTKVYHVPNPVADPQGLWLRMNDAIHPSAQGHLAFYRELAPLFHLSPTFPWEDIPS